MAVAAHDTVLIAARGTGKSEGGDAPYIIRNVWEMPGSFGGLITPSYAKGWANTLPAIIHALQEWGYKPGIHFYVGRKAPESAQFAQPKRPVFSTAWHNSIHFWNGTLLTLISFNNSMSANSMSLDWLIGPEAKFLDYDKIKSEVNPANRGNITLFGDCPHHHATFYSTDMPTTKSGRWLLDARKKVDGGHINLLRNIYRRLVVCKTAYLSEPSESRLRELNALRRDLDMARKYRPVGDGREFTAFVGMYDIFDNLEVVGEDYIREMYRDSPPLVWRTAFMNEELVKVENGFYAALDDAIHFYIPKDDGHTDRMRDVKGQALAGTCLEDDDVDYGRPLHIAFDANAAISSMVIGQFYPERDLLKVIRSAFVKSPGLLSDLVKGFCKYYLPFLKRQVFFYYDHTFVWSTAQSADSYADVIRRGLREAGWKVTDVCVGQAPPHAWKYEGINRSLRGAPGKMRLRFNLMNNEYLHIAMQQAGVRQGRNGFEKDKSAERMPDSPQSPDEYKTHITDAFDTLWYGVGFFVPGSGASADGLGYVVLGGR